MGSRLVPELLGLPQNNRPHLGAKPPGPVARSHGNVVRISMKKYASDSCQAVMKALQRRVWEKTKTQTSALTPTSSAARGVGLIK